ncbi:hypothetical protein Pyn_10035 [Prunus yedoensis var. nudiflora]|uniref:Uncharacterized protein n=1 Tax=Prunus yedoensis var. nudiflora TaxID=2094558 RepID=A0A314YWP1_PRUYE|nr:hypothetical protein Pyn_10035 [Prunus yedoensis var. nudiflora]
MNAADEQGDINEMADAFIKKFRNQLKIQREESFKRFQEMIAHGVNKMVPWIWIRLFFAGLLSVCLV